ncbi:1,2-dihydroxynaphthalene dioxygenase [Bradyrhizobium ivorense]|uniref:1,2-dihydroxynaphthalene dioxygenase n=1 Tax=Bradyrhizobium ivorense TaxID=2511166 RepID=A0A508TF89_9BRAD|nr:VOC family protein [Bradyrhizobium ivorense]VIO73120.1 1,2-dihydroxynaphthalene dioxygenase [Bradyrhizobium ivorense]
MTGRNSTERAPQSPLIALCYVRLAVREPLAAATFATDILGLQPVPDKQALFRSDDRYHTLSLVPEPTASSIGIEVSDEAALERIEQALQTDGFIVRRSNRDESRQRFVRDAVIAQDASGNEIDLVLRPAQSGRRYFPSRDAGITGLQGVGLRSTRLKDDQRFWTSILGARISDWAGDVTYLGIDRKHHRVALYPSDRAGILYVSYGVESLDAVMQSHYFVQERQIRVLHGPGREPASGQIFLRFEGPEGHVFSYTHGLNDIEPGHHPRQFSAHPTSLCEWGSQCQGIPELQPADH